jgi:hypothetical protein
MESSIPLGMTCDAWRRWRSPRLRRRQLPALSGWATHPAARRSALRHFHESTTRYGHDQKLVSFLLVCRVCGIEKLVHRQPYQPRFEPHPVPRFRGGAIGSAGQQQPDASDQAGTR